MLTKCWNCILVYLCTSPKSVLNILHHLEKPVLFLLQHLLLLHHWTSLACVGRRNFMKPLWSLSISLVGVNVRRSSCLNFLLLKYPSSILFIFKRNIFNHRWPSPLTAAPPPPPATHWRVQRRWWWLWLVRPSNHHGSKEINNCDKGIIDLKKGCVLLMDKDWKVSLWLK